MKSRAGIFYKILVILAIALVLSASIFVFKRFFKKDKGLLGGLPKIAEIKEKLQIPGPLIGPVSPTRAEVLDNKEIIKWTNYYRQKENLALLSENNLLENAASQKVNDMFEKQYFAHISESGQSAADLVKAQEYQYKIVGENLALGDFKDEKDLVDAWMASPGHRANILNPDYQEIGVASRLSQYQDRTTWLSVQIFATSAPSCSLPDTKLKQNIETKEIQYNQAQALYQEGVNLINQGNTKIKEGNTIYQQTGDRAQAEPYWTEGENLQKQGQEKINQAGNLDSFSQEIKSLINQYNAQVQGYNQCIGE